MTDCIDIDFLYNGISGRTSTITNGLLMIKIFDKFESDAARG